MGFGQVLQSAGSQISDTMLAHLAGSLLLSIPRWSSQLEMMWCRIVRVCTYRSIPWGHLMAFVNFDSYDRRFMGVVGRKEMVLESQSGEKGEALIAGPFDWWNAGNGCVAIEPEDTYVTLRYDIYGESGSTRFPCRRGWAP